MKKLLYLAISEVDSEKPSGVAKKILNQYDVFNKYYDTTLISYGKDGIIISDKFNKEVVPYGKTHRKYQIYKVAISLVLALNYDFVYIRYPRSDFAFIKLLKKIRKNIKKIIIEIPTYPYNLEKPKNNILKEYTLRIFDKLYRTKLKKYVDYILTYSDDNYIWDIKTIKTINGIDFQKTKLKENIYHDSISLISCAYYYDCHGCDRIIEGLHQYYNNGGKENITFNIVGDGDIIKQYKTLTIKYGLSKHVLFHGYCNGERLDNIYNVSDIGINSLAIHRLGLNKESTLKTKEYAARGLPIVSTYLVDAFSFEDNKKFVLLIPQNDSPVDIQKIVDFYYTIYNDKSINIAKKIRNASVKVCDMEVTLKPLIDAFER